MKNIQTLTLPIEGMTCASCVTRVENALREVPGVTSVSVNLATEKAKVVLDDQHSQIESLRKAVEEIGYTLVVPQHESSARETAESLELRKIKEFASLKRDLQISVIFGIPIMVISMLSMTHWWMSTVNLSMEAVNILLFVATSVVMVFPGRRFFRAAFKLIQHAQVDMNTLVATGTGVAYVFSSIVTLIPSLLDPGYRAVYFDTASTIITLIVLGKFLEAKAKIRTSEAMKRLMQLQPSSARIRRDGVETEVPIEQISVGDLFIVRPGERIPLDGRIVEGFTAIDESMVTGESMPVEKKPGESVIGGTINSNGSIVCAATAVGEGTVLAQIIRMVEEAQGSKAPIQTLADSISSVFVPTVIVIALVTFIVSLFVFHIDATTAMIHSIAVLIIACPCALGLATPTAIIVGMGKGTSYGILFRNVESLEHASKITTIVMDKTGTLTKGRPSVTDIIPLSSYTAEEIMSYAAALENKSEHPLAKSIMRYVEDHKIPLLQSESFISNAGFGVLGKVDGKEVIIGNISFMKENLVRMNDIPKDIEVLTDQGKTLVFVAMKNTLIGVIGVADTILESSREAVNRFASLGIQTVMLTGDSHATAQAVAKDLQISMVVAGMTPKQKAEHISSLQQKGSIIAMIGDGVNDAPALAQADVSIALGTGTDVAMETADITLLQHDLRIVETATKLSKQTVRTIRQNLFWAFIYNVIGIPLAAFGVLDPMIAAGAMAMSSVSVLGNSLRLKRITL